MYRTDMYFSFDFAYDIPIQLDIVLRKKGWVGVGQGLLNRQNLLKCDKSYLFTIPS